MTTVPETAVAGSLVIGGVLLAVALFSGYHPTPSTSSATTVVAVCKNGYILSNARQLCYPIGSGKVDISLDNGDRFSIPPGEAGTLTLVQGGILVENVSKTGTQHYNSPTTIYVLDTDHFYITVDGTILQLRPY